MTTVSATTIRRVALFLGALSVLMIAGVLWSDRFVAADPDRVMTAREAWDAGMIQGFLLLHLLLGACAIGIWYWRHWARWVAFVWFPLLAANNLGTEFWHGRSVHAEAWLQAAFISTLWLVFLYRFLASRHAAMIFDRHRSGA